MKYLVKLSFLLLLTYSTSAQNMQKLKDSNIEFLPIQHATFILKTDSTIIYVDPFGVERNLKTYLNPILF